MKFYKLLILLSICIHANTYGHLQPINRTVDSLKYILKISEGKEKVDLLNLISKYYSYSDKYQISKYANAALELARKSNYNEGSGEALYNLGFGYYINNRLDSASYFAARALKFTREHGLKNIEAKALNVLGLLQWKKGKFEEAFKHFKLSFETAKELNLKEVEAKAAHYLGLVSELRGQYSEAIEYFLGSVKINEELNNKIEAAITLNNLAKIYNRIDNYEKAIQYARTALKYANSLHDGYSRSRALNNLGESYAKLNKPAKALEFLERAKTIKAEIKDSVGLAYVLEDMAECNIRLGNLNEGEKYYLEALAIRKRKDMPQSLARSLFKLADVKLKTGKFWEAKKLIDEGMKFSDPKHSKEILMTANKLYSHYFEKTGNFKKAFEYYKKYDSIIHDILNKEERKRIAELEIKYDLSKKEKENILLKKENKIKELELDYQKGILYFIAVVSAMGVILIFVLYRRMRANKMSNIVLTQKNLQIEKANKELGRRNKLILEHQKKLDKTLEILKNEVAERKKYEQELITAKNKAEEANKLKSEFLAGISHEIRTPVNTILSYISLLKEDLPGNGNSNNDFSEYFEPIQTGANRLIRTIDSILNMSQFQSGEFEIFKEKFDIYKDILTGLHKEFVPIANKKGLRLSLECKVKDKTIWADQYTVTQLFTNLIDNAIKYTKEGFVRISVDKEDGKYVYVSVEDSGIGIAPEFIPDLFEPFQQEEMGYSRAFDGNGLGLALVKKYVEVNKGKITVESEKGKGTKFTVALVLASTKVSNNIKNQEINS